MKVHIFYNLVGNSVRPARAPPRAKSRCAFAKIRYNGRKDKTFEIGEEEPTKKTDHRAAHGAFAAEPCRLRRKGAGRHPVRLRRFARFRALQRGGRVHGRREQHARIQLPCAKNRVGNGGRRRAERRDRRSIRRARAGAEEHDGLPRFAHMPFRHVDELLERQPALPCGARGDGRRHEHDGDAGSYDFFGGKRLMSEDLLARCELSTQDFITAARRTAANYFDETYRDALSGSMGGADFIASYAERRAWTLSDENINAEMRLYLDGGALHMIVPVGSFAGAESYDADLALDLSTRETVEKTAQDSFVKAALSGGDLTVSFEKTADSAWYAENFRFDYETIYPVEGLYSDYTDVFVGSVGQGYFPYIFLLTSEGTVEYVNLLEGLTAGFLCDGGPLGGVKGIVSFESGEVEEDYGTYQTVFAVDASGEKHDLSGAVSDADYTIPSEFLGEWTATVTHDTAEQGSYDSDYILTLTDGGGLTVQDINSEVGLYFEYTGQLNYLGTNGEGMVFGYHLNENAGTVRYGAFTLLRGSDGLHVKSVAGENFFDAPSGRYTVFARG